MRKQLIYTSLLALSVLSLSFTASAKDVQHNMRVDGITCPFCVATSAKELKKIDGVTNVDSDLEKGIIKVCANESVEFTDEQLTKLFINKGFTYKGKETVGDCEDA